MPCRGFIFAAYDPTYICFDIFSPVWEMLRRFRLMRSDFSLDTMGRGLLSHQLEENKNLAYLSHVFSSRLIISQGSMPRIRG